MAMRLITMLVALVASTVPSTAAEPALPPGLDPGGVPVATIGPGYDYTQTTVSQCLARDGEGVLIGWDFTDDDVRPHAQSAEGNAITKILCAAPSDAAASPVSLIAIKADLAAAAALPSTIGFATQTPARVILLAAKAVTSDMSRWMQLAARQFPKQVFVTATPKPTDQASAQRPLPTPPNLILVNTTGAKTPSDVVVRIDQAAATAAQARATPNIEIVTLVVRALAALCAKTPPGDAAKLKSKLLQQLGAAGNATTVTLTRAELRQRALKSNLQ